MPSRFDLQSHSTNSDGVLSATDVVARAAEAGVELLALSDHDTIAGVAEAIDAGREHGVKIVPAVEISAVDEGAPEPRELHILGYNIDYTGPPMTVRLEDFLADREHRTLRMRDALREVGFDLDEAEIEERIAAGKPIGGIVIVRNDLCVHHTCQQRAIGEDAQARSAPVRRHVTARQCRLRHCDRSPV